MRRVTLRRKPKADPVTPEVRAAVLFRDRECLMYQFDRKHVCRDQWGTPHAPWALPMLSVEHVHEGYAVKGKRAPSDTRHMVALCQSANIGAPSKEARAFFREYLARVAA